MATGTSHPATAPVFHGDDPEQTTEYTTLSVLAIIAFVFGLAAPLAIAGPFLLAIPFFGIAVALVALRRIAVSGGVLSGRWLATIGLGLCVASAVLPISHTLIQRAMRQHEAEVVGRNWVTLVTSGELKKAFQLTVDSTRPAPPPEPGAPPKPAPYDAFINHPVIKALQAAGKDAEIRIRDTIEFQAASYRNFTVRQLYEVTPAPASSSGSSAKPIEFILSIQRATLARESMSRWMITAYTFPTPDANSSAAR
jgi:hypothetical protein